MTFNIKPILSGENSIVVALATAGLVIGIYNMKLGPVADVHATGAYDGNMQAAIKKAGWEAVAAVAAVTLLARDPNIAIMGGAAIIFEEMTNRHALISNPDSGQIQQLPPAAYAPASDQGAATVTDMGTYQAAAG